MNVVASLYDQPAEKVAVILGDRQISYGDFRRDIDRAAEYLRAEGFGAESKIAIFTGPAQGRADYASWIAHLATMRIGAAHASIHDRTTLENLRPLMGFDALVGTLPKSAEADGLRVVPFDLEAMAFVDGSADAEDKAARLNATSGTTGKPKAIRWDSAMIAARVDQVADIDLIDSSTILHSMLAPRTTAGFRYPIATWRAGGTVILSNTVRAADGTITALGATVLICSPYQLSNMGKKRAWPNRDKRTIVALGGRLPRGVRDWALRQVAGKIIVCYGSTEAGNVAFGDAMLIDRHPGAVGHVRDGVEIEIVGPDGGKLTAGEAGSIKIRTTVMADQDGSGDRERWFEPGDRAILFPDGVLAIAGRSTDVLNFGGMKLSAVDIETKLMASGVIDDVALVTIPGQYSDLPSMAIVAKPGFERERLIGDVRGHLPKGVRCSLVLVPAIPRNEMGKIDRPRLARQLGARLRRQPNRTQVNA